MGAYISSSDVIDVFGQDNVYVWSNLEGGTTLNAARVTAAIAYAEEDVENRFRNGRYVLPFSPIPYVLKYWCSVLAGLWLFNCRPDYPSESEEDNEEARGYTRLAKKIEKDIDAYVAGQRILACALTSGGKPTAPIVVGTEEDA